MVPRRGGEGGTLTVESGKGMEEVGWVRGCLLVMVLPAPPAGAVVEVRPCGVEEAEEVEVSPSARGGALEATESVSLRRESGAAPRENGERQRLLL